MASPEDVLNEFSNTVQTNMLHGFSTPPHDAKMRVQIDIGSNSTILPLINLFLSGFPSKVLTLRGITGTNNLVKKKHARVDASCYTHVLLIIYPST